MPNDVTYPVPAAADGWRLDVFLLSVIPTGATRGDVQRAIRSGRVTVDEKQFAKPGSIVHAGQTVRVQDGAWQTPTPTLMPDATVPLAILHEDPQLIVINKQPGLPVHAGIKRVHPTLADVLIARYPALAEVGEDPLRPGIVHRLDKDTSGILLIARTPEMFSFLKDAFQKRHVKKHYVAVVRGRVPEDGGIIKLPLMRSKRNPLRRAVVLRGGRKPVDGDPGKEAETSFQVRERFAHYTLLDVFPLTGRMHQIRVHLAHLGFPVVGDLLYGRKTKETDLPPVRRHLLHAAGLTLTLPSGKTRTFEAPLPEDMAAILTHLREAEKQRSPKGKPLHFRPWRPSHPGRPGGA